MYVLKTLGETVEGSSIPEVTGLIVKPTADGFTTHTPEREGQQRASRPLFLLCSRGFDLELQGPDWGIWPLW